MTLMLPPTGAAALHVMLLRISRAQDAYEVFGWTAASVFTYAEIQARWHEFCAVMDYRAYEQSPVWWRLSKAVRDAFRAARLAASQRWTWAMQIVADREKVLYDLGGGEYETDTDETDTEA
jgi:hypothetical protein